jgi:putative endonuclease
MTSSGCDAFFVYILRCSDRSLYVGYTSDVDERLKAHNDGRAAAWTASRRPVELAYRERHAEERAAIARERQIKGWTHEKKLALIRGDRAMLKELAKRRAR